MPTASRSMHLGLRPFSQSLSPTRYASVRFLLHFLSFFSAAALVLARTETISGQDKQINFDGKWRNVGLRRE